MTTLKNTATPKSVGWLLLVVSLGSAAWWLCWAHLTFIPDGRFRKLQVISPHSSRLLKDINLATI